MKKQLSKKTIWQSLISLVAMLIIIFVATGSFELLLFSLGDQGKSTTIELSSGELEQTVEFSNGVTIKRVGNRNKYGEWEGVMKIAHYNANAENNAVPVKTEEGEYINGLRNGKFTILYSDKPGKYICYKMGNVVPCEKSAMIATAEVSAFDALNKYPWYLDLLNLFGFDNEHIKAYTDTLEAIIATNEYDITYINDYYQDALDSLENTVYDSIISVNWGLTFYLGNERLKKSEFRMAIIDRYLSETNSTYNTVKNTYPGYLLSLNEADITDQDFEMFCHEFDSLLESYTPLDLEDPFFTDSIDSQMERAFAYITSTEKSALLLSQELKSAQINLKPVLKQFFLENDPTDVASYISTLLLYDYIMGDLMRISVIEAYYKKSGLIQVPVVTTEYDNGPSPNNAIINGYVIEDGGANVTSRGIVWATYYNPTINNNIEASGAGTGEYSTTLSGLTAGNTYYARAYATNSEGTAYGNCISFIARSTVGIENKEINDSDFKIFPNPASKNTTLSFYINQSESMVLTIVNLNGQVVIEKDLGQLSNGKNQILVNLSELQSGLYDCGLSNKSGNRISQKLMVVN